MCSGSYAIACDYVNYQERFYKVEETLNYAHILTPKVCKAEDNTNQIDVCLSLLSLLYILKQQIINYIVTINQFIAYFTLFGI